MALRANGQSIIVSGIGAATGVATSLVFVFVAAFGAEWAPCFAQQWCDSIEAQAPPLATIVEPFVVETTSLAVAALTIFSQPSMQPAPAIHKATVNASVTRIILMEEKNLILT